MYASANLCSLQNDISITALPRTVAGGSESHRAAVGAGHSSGGAAAEFADVGFLSPQRILSAVECQRFMRASDNARRVAPLDWSKGRAVTSRAYYEIAARPAILDVVRQLL